jgi:hypothetical protein
MSIFLFKDFKLVPVPLWDDLLAAQEAEVDVALEDDEVDETEVFTARYVNHCCF